MEAVKCMKKGKNIKVILRKPIDYYFEQGMISTRALNICRSCGIVTVGDLIRCYHKGNLRKLRNCGPYTENEFKSVMGLVNYNYAVQLLEKLDGYDDMPAKLKDIIADAYKRPLLDFSLDCIKLFYDTFGDSKAFYTYFFCDQQKLAKRFNGRRSNELKHYCYQLLTEIHSTLREKGLDDTYTYELVVIARAIIWFSDESFAAELEEKDPELKVRRQALVIDYEDRTKKHFRGYWEADIKKLVMPTYSKALALLTMKDDEIRKIWYNLPCWRYNSYDLSLVIAELRETLFLYESIGGDELGKTVVMNNYRYLTEKQAWFVADFHKQFGYYPMFYLLREYLMKTTDREEWVFAKATGIYDGHPMSFEEIGKELDLGKIRVRQLFNCSMRYLFRDKEWQHYQFRTALVVTEVDDMYRSVVENEKVSIPFESFAIICTDGFMMKLATVNDMRFLINYRLNISDIAKVCSVVKARNNRIKGEANSLRLVDLLKDIPEDKRKLYMEALPVIINKAYGLVVDEAGNIVLPPKGVDVVYELTQILRKKGKPMSFDELQAALIKKCPAAKDKSSEYIRGKILQSETIKPIGKSMRYSLTEWEHVYKGTIRQLVADILNEAKRPVHIDKIMKKVLKAYPKTTKRNVVSSINQDEARFICFGDGLYGLMEKTYSKKYEGMKVKLRVDARG